MSQNLVCLNMIVKNESENILRCLDSVARHIDCWVICDTGSTDKTQDIILNYFERRGIPGKLCNAPFITWEQARNAALDAAESSDL